MPPSPDDTTSVYKPQRVSDSVLEVREVTKRFGGNVAVDALSLSVSRGVVAGLIGPNGAGKSTLFDLLAGVQTPTKGRIMLDALSIERTPAYRRARLGLGRTFQVARPFPALSVVENVMLGRHDQSGEAILPNWFTPRKVHRQERETLGKAMDLLRFVSLDRLATQPARVLSGGQRKLLEIARVMMGDPRVLLLDEPAAGVNPSLLDIIMDRIATINARGVTVFLIEHNMDLVTRLCSHVFVMAQGRLLCEGAPDTIARDPRVIEAYLGSAAA
ncbi:ABC transporter ATP-binding protein [Lichenifustis flavocetrariae]|uniref:ABC transporter ATP-binding protein n=1 Tax=Lichenifustis flavocetrariae TaxID=2949735 RepID=A0AA41YTK4_9HYPH|nr:ABC transporter ATP-binding protein [Lichenifustis flavocetrariae]MCW6506772.1 ABC transporter ATP-binding protein [Lichenifustis flavocetrariae]